MASSQGFADFVLEQMASLGRVSAKRMFGGFGIYRDSLMFALIADDELYLKAGDANRGQLIDLGGRSFRPFEGRGKMTALPYVSVSIDIVEDADQLVRLSGQALNAALAGKTEPKAKRKKP